MAIEKVKEYFRQYEMEFRIQELSESSATVELAAGLQKLYRFWCTICRF